MSKTNVSSLTSRVVETVKATAATVNDSDQRSALGMARTWVEKREPIKRQTAFAGLYKGRDDLAEELVRIMAGARSDECVAALNAARNWVNEPFQRNPAMLAREKQRAAAGMVGSEKKNEKMVG